MESKWMLGLSTCGEPIDEALFANCRQWGVEALEISPSSKAYDALDYDALSRLSQAYGLCLHSFHLPFSPFRELDLSRKDLAKHTVERLGELIRKAGQIGISTFVVHASGEPIADSDRPDRLAQATESLAFLSDLCQSQGGVLAVENLPRTCLGRNAQEIALLLQASPAMGVCLDTNHLMGQTLPEFIAQVGHRIITTHLSDYDFTNERHWLPGEGQIRWTACMQALEKADYRGPLLYEVGFVAPWSIHRPQDLTFQDFQRNHRSLLAKQQPAGVGTPKPGLGMWDFAVNEK